MTILYTHSPTFCSRIHFQNTVLYITHERLVLWKEGNNAGVGWGECIVSGYLCSTALSWLLCPHCDSPTPHSSALGFTPPHRDMCHSTYGSWRNKERVCQFCRHGNCDHLAWHVENLGKSKTQWDIFPSHSHTGYNLSAFCSSLNWSILLHCHIEEP
jgi:hypothetical protein